MGKVWTPDWTDKKGIVRNGFYMDNYLIENFLDVPKFLEKKHDFIGLVSGHAAVGIGKTLLPSTQIRILENGIILDRPLFSFKDKENIKTVSYDFKNKKFTYADSQIIKEKEMKDFYKVVLENKEVICSMDHKLFILRDNKILESRLRDIKVGDLLVCKKEEKYRCPKLFYLKGAFDGDGHYQKNRNYITINVTDFDFLDEIKLQIKNVFDKEVNIVKQLSAHDNCKEQRRINFNCGEDIYKLIKNINPNNILENIEYLKGIFDAEGSVGICSEKIIRNGIEYKGNKKWLTLSQKDTKSLILWQSYLNELGIKSNRVFRNDGRSYISIKDNLSIMRFSKLIGFRIKRKQNILDRIINNLSHSQLSKEEYSRIMDIYQNTNFGSTYIGLLFGRDPTSIERALRRRNVILNKKNCKINKPLITLADISYVEKVMQKPFNLKIHPSKLEPSLRTSKICEKVINQYNIKDLELFRDSKRVINESLNSLKLLDSTISELNEDILNINVFEEFKNSFLVSPILSIEYHSSDFGYDIFTPIYHNFLLSNNILSHNSTIASQVAWLVCLLVNGSKVTEIIGPKGGRVLNVGPPKNIEKFLAFSLDNVVFSAEKLVEKAQALPRNSVIVFDEARLGLLGRDYMSEMNKLLESFFQECRQFGHCMILVLPDFFKLHEWYATSRSHWLIDCFFGPGFERGHYSFFNQYAKEQLYQKGKKMIGTNFRYGCQAPIFQGKFGSWTPYPQKEYDLAKKAGLADKMSGKFARNHKLQRDLLIYAYQISSGYTAEEMYELLADWGFKNLELSNIRSIVSTAKNSLDAKGISEDDIAGPGRLNFEEKKNLRLFKDAENKRRFRKRIRDQKEKEQRERMDGIETENKSDNIVNKVDDRTSFEILDELDRKQIEKEQREEELKLQEEESKQKEYIDFKDSFKKLIDEDKLNEK